jgi:ABC-2 type transport system permease protein
MFAALYAGIGAISNNMREGPQYAIIFSIPMVIPIWLQSLITLQPDGPFAVFLSIFPLTSPLAMLQRMLVSSVPPWQIILSLGVLLLAAIGAVWFAARLFRVQSLLAGQVPRLRDFPALLRG